MTLSTIWKLGRMAFRSWPATYVVWPTMIALFVAGPTSFLACRGDSIHLRDWFADHTIALYLCHTWPVISLIMIRLGQGIYQEHRRRTNPNDETLMKLFLVLDNVVGSKSERFANYAVKSASDGKAVFFDITQPEVQIECLVDAAYQFFESTKTDKEATFRVALAEMGAKHIERFFCFNPKDRPPRNGIEEYQKDWSGFTRSKRRRDLLVVSDIAKELCKKPKNRSFAATKGGPQEGSMIVYPIVHRGQKEVVYCLSVLCSIRGYFKNSKNQQEYYRDVMERFAKRIELEHSLRLIKRGCNGDAGSGRDANARQDRS